MQVKGAVCSDGVTAGPDTVDNVVELVEGSTEGGHDQAVEASVRLQLDRVVHIWSTEPQVLAEMGDGVELLVVKQPHHLPDIALLDQPQHVLFGT